MIHKEEGPKEASRARACAAASSVRGSGVALLGTLDGVGRSWAGRASVRTEEHAGAGPGGRGAQHNLQNPFSM